jgi:GntR family transcriptional regulator, transcriptional repressor for pyruvate dehydrogenase complex
MHLELKPARREKLADNLYGQILEQIMLGRLKEGDRLPSESEIGQAFKVSRPVVREALTRLQADGLVYARRGSGSFVKQRPPARLTDFAAASDVAGLLRAIEARMALEPEIARLAAERATERQLRAIADALAALEESGNGRNEDFAFHRAIAEATGNEIFPALLDSMRELVLGGIDVATRLTRIGSQARRERVLAEHRQIYDAIASRDRAGAGVLMHYHLLQARGRTTNYQRHP